MPNRLSLPDSLLWLIEKREADDRRAEQSVSPESTVQETPELSTDRRQDDRRN